MANIFCISDLHLGHAKCLFEFTRPDGTPLRDFRSVDEMHEVFITRWNSVVKPKDHVYHGGDVVIKKEYLSLVKSFNGELRNIGGNHDIYPVQAYLNAGFEKVFGCRKLDNMMYTHIPIHISSMARFLGNIHGHIHAQPSPEGPYVNVSCEALDYYPMALEDVKKLMIQRRQAWEDKNGTVELHEY